MTLIRLKKIPGLKVGDCVVCTSANGHGHGLPRPWWTVGETYTVERVDEPYQPFVRADDGSLSGLVSGYFAPAPRETVEERPVTLTDGCFGVTRGGELLGPFKRLNESRQWRPVVSAGRLWRDGGQRYYGGIDEDRIIATFPTRAAAEAHLRGEPEGETRCAECDCKNGGAECTWIATPTPDPADPADQAELIASLRQVIADMEGRGGIDWEQRRWDAMLAALPEAVNDYGEPIMGNGSKQRRNHGSPVLPYSAAAIGSREEIIARQARRYADALISAARGETQ